MKKVFYTLLLVSLVSGFVSAQTITVWNTGGDSDTTILNAAADLFKQSHPDVTFDIQPISWQDAHAKVLSAVVSGSGPDIITGGLSWGIEFGKQGGMVDLKAEYPDVVSKVEGLAQPGIYSSVVPPSGEVYGVPFDLTLQIFITRPDLLQQEDVGATPQTWDELKTALEKDGNKGLGFGWGNASWLGYFPFLYQAGGTLYNADCSEATINSPAGVEALNFFASLYNTYDTSPEADVDVEGGLASGEYLAGYQGSWVLGLESSRPDLYQQVDFSALPAGPTGKRTSFIGGRVIGVMEASPNKDLAAEFIGSLYTPEAAQAMLSKAAELNQIWITPVADYAQQSGLPDKVQNALAAQLEDAVGPPNCAGWEETQAFVDRQLQDVILNGADSQKALDAAAQEMNKKLN